MGRIINFFKSLFGLCPKPEDTQEIERTAIKAIKEKLPQKALRKLLAAAQASLNARDYMSLRKNLLLIQVETFTKLGRKWTRIVEIIQEGTALIDRRRGSISSTDHAALQAVLKNVKDAIDRI